MSEFYSPEIKRIFKTFKWQYPVTVDAVEHPTVNGATGYLELRIYRPEIEMFSEPQKLIIAEQLYDLQDLIREAGTPCFVQGALTAPPNKANLYTK